MAEKNLMDELELIKKSIKDHKGSPFDVSKDKINELLKDIHSEKIGSLQVVIDEINTLIAERKQLSEKVIAEINEISTKVDTLLMQAANNPENYREQMSLREKQILIEEAKVRERVECWRDIALLKRELRERIKEFTEQESKISVMDGILSAKPE